MNLLSVDPGKRTIGACWWEAGILRHAWLIRGLGPGECALSLSHLVNGMGPVGAIVTETQQVYGGPRREDPNDLLPLAFCNGAVHALIPAKNRAFVLPRIWTRGVPKDVRLRRWKAVGEPGGLSFEEAKILAAAESPKALEHNLFDAYGIGKWYLGGGTCEIIKDF